MEERPIILTDKIAAVNEEEIFQNEVIRPIIKSMHELLILSIKHYITNYKNALYKIPDEQKGDYLEKFIWADTKIKTELKGMVIGRFSPAEYTAYLKIKSGVNKRIIGILKKRVVDSLDQLQIN